MSKRLRFEKLQDRQCETLLKFLIAEEVYFSVICAVKNVNFTPALPKEILDGFQPLSLFILAGYTFASLEIMQNSITFEAGFGSDNIGSFVQIDFRHILQILIANKKGKDIPIFTRLDGGEIFEDTYLPSKEEELQQSMEAILSNPHNQKYFH